MNIRFPNITGNTEAEQLVQVKSYLHQLVEQLNWALSAIESGAGTGATTASNTGSSGSEADATSFNDMKALIIKTAETVNYYYEKVTKKLESQ